MKKKLSLLIAAILSLSLLTACGGDEVTPVGAYDNDDEWVSIVFDDDGTCEFSSFEMVIECTYTVRQGSLEIESDDATVSGTYDADTDTFTLDGYAGEFYYVDEAWYTP